MCALGNESVQKEVEGGEIVKLVRDIAIDEVAIETSLRGLLRQSSQMLVRQCIVKLELKLTTRYHDVATASSLWGAWRSGEASA